MTDDWTDRAGEPGEPAEFMQPPDEIICVDCGGTCHRLTYPERDDNGHDLPFEPGDVIAYRCRDCLDRWDIVLE